MTEHTSPQVAKLAGRIKKKLDIKSFEDEWVCVQIQDESEFDFDLYPLCTVSELKAVFAELTQARDKWEEEK